MLNFRRLFPNGDDGSHRLIIFQKVGPTFLITLILGLREHGHDDLLLAKDKLALSNFVIR